MPFRVVPIVEGHGEFEAVGILFHRLISEFDLGLQIKVEPPIRQSKSRLMKAGGLESAVELAAEQSGDNGAVFVLIDSDGDCPRNIAPELLARAQRARADRKICVIVAHHEYEAWFLASASSLKGCRRLSEGIQDHPTPEEVQNCKGWLEEWMPRNSKYSETVDQPALTALFNLSLARRSLSFDKLYRDFKRVCLEAQAAQEPA